MSFKSFDNISYEVDGHKATITLNRPDALNALSPHMISELRAAYDEAENDDDVWLLIVTGTRRAFCTGADVNEIPGDGKVINERPYLSTYEQWEAPQEGTPPFRRMAKPVLAAINGLCCGAGLDWVTTGDIVIASEKATFFDPHVSIGLVAGREVVRLARVLPRTVALRMALMGKHERMSAERAYDLGMITEIVEHDRLLERAHEIADVVNSNAAFTGAPPSHCGHDAGAVRRLGTAGAVPPDSSPRLGSDGGEKRVYLDHAFDIGAFNPSFPVYRFDHLDPDTASGSVVFPLVYEGPPGLVNGGFLAVFFDCVTQHQNCAAALSGKTRSLTVTYRRPTPILTELRFDIVRTQIERGVKSTARLILDDEVLCIGELSTVALPPDKLAGHRHGKRRAD